MYEKFAFISLKLVGSRSIDRIFLFYLHIKTNKDYWYAGFFYSPYRLFRNYILYKRNVFVHIYAFSVNAEINSRKQLNHEGERKTKVYSFWL